MQIHVPKAAIPTGRSLSIRMTLGDLFLVKFVKLAPISYYLADLTMDESP